MQILNFSINLDKLDKSKIVKGKKGKYYNMTAFISDEEDQFGNDVSVITSQTEDERKEKAERTYLGNGKVAFDSNRSSDEHSGGDESSDDEDDSNDLPF